MPRLRIALLLTIAALLALPASAMARPADALRGPASGASEPGAAALRAGLARAGATITTRRIEGFGEVLADARGLPLYAFGADRGRTSRCYGACVAAWPVVYAGGTPRAAGRAQQALLGTTRRRGGRAQVTYRGRPVYTYRGDRPGVALCHGVREYGGVWVLVRANGKLVA